MKILIHVPKTGQILSFIDPDLAVSWMNKLTNKGVTFTTKTLPLTPSDKIKMEKDND